MSYHRRGISSSYLIVRRKGNSPIRVVAGERFRTKKKAEKEAREWNKAYKGSDVKFMICKRAQSILSLWSSWQQKALRISRET